MSKVINLPANFFGLNSGKKYSLKWEEKGDMSGWETNCIDVDPRDIIYGEPALNPGKACPEAAWSEDRDGLWYASIKVGV